MDTQTFDIAQSGFTGWYSPWRHVLERMDGAALALSAHGGILGFNIRAAALLGWRTGDVEHLCDIVAGASCHGLPPLDTSLPMVLRCADGGRLDFVARLRNLRGGEGSTVLMCLAETVDKGCHGPGHPGPLASAPEGRADGGDMARQALHCAPDAMMLEDLGGRVIMANPAAERMLSCVPGGALGLELAPLLGAGIDDHPFLATLDTRTYECLRTPLLDAQGRLHATSLVARDVTSELHARECARQAMVAGSRLVANASHDLCEPVQALYVLSEALSHEQLSLQGRAVLDRVEAGLDTMRDLLAGVLDVNRLQKGALTPRPVALRDNVLLHSIVAGFETSARVRGVELSVDALGVVMTSDHAMLSSVLRNLVQNALRSTAPGGRVGLCSRLEDQHLVVCVHDTGCGIGESKLALIWQEFYQGHDSLHAHNDTTPATIPAKGPAPGGVGLGLSIVSTMCQAMGHKVVVHSQVTGPAHGSRFEVWVPLAQL